MTEKWLPVVGYEGHYEVSDHGNVRSVKLGRNISTWMLNTGYPCVSLYKFGARSNQLVHRLVAIAFLGNPGDGFEVCHKDGSRDNPHLKNLRWDSRSGNHLDKRTHGTDWQVAKSRCPRGHKLIAPNLVTRDARNGRRSCRACSQEHRYKWEHSLEFSKDRADIYYDRIMKRGEVDKTASAGSLGIGI